MSLKSILFGAAVTLVSLGGCGINTKDLWDFGKDRHMCANTEPYDPAVCYCEDYDPKAPTWSCSTTTCCQHDPKHFCNTKPACDKLGTGGSGSGGTGTGTPTGIANVVTVLNPSVAQPYQCQPFEIGWVYTNTGTGDAATPTGGAIPVLHVVNDMSKREVAGATYPWTSTIKPNAVSTEFRLELKNGFGLPLEGDGFGWTAWIESTDGTYVYSPQLHIAVTGTGDYSCGIVK